MNFPHTFDLINLAVRVQLLLFSQGLSRRPVLHPVSSEALSPHSHKKSNKEGKPTASFFKTGCSLLLYQRGSRRASCPAIFVQLLSSCASQAEL